MDRRKFFAWLGAGYASNYLTNIADTQRPAWPPSSAIDDEAFWQQVRAQFPVTKNRVYLNTGGLGPAPYSVIDK